MLVLLAFAGAMSRRPGKIIAPITQPHNFAQDSTNHQWKPTAKWEQERGAERRADFGFTVVREEKFLSALHESVLAIREADGVFVEGELKYSSSLGYIATIYIGRPGEQYAPDPARVGRDYAAAIRSAAGSGQVVVGVKEIGPVKGYYRQVGIASMTSDENEPFWRYGQ